MSMILYALLICTLQATKLFPSVDETLTWNLFNLVGPIDEPLYTITQAGQYFNIQDPIHQISKPINHIQPSETIIASKAMKTPMQSWLNHFLFIDQDDENVDLYYSENSQDQMEITPYFSERIEIIKTNKNIRCYDADYLTKTQFIIDCADISVTPIVNSFYIAATDGVTDHYTNTNSPTSVAHRIIHVSTLVPESTIKYLIRGTPKYALPDNEDSTIEVFQVLDRDTAPTLKSTLTSDKLRIILNQGDTYRFQLVDFKITQDGHIQILDKNALYTLQMNANGEWSKINSRIISQSYSFDYVEVVNDDGLITTILAILQGSTIQIYLNHSDDAKVIKLPINIVKQPARISISEYYLVVQYSKTLYLYSINGEQLLQRLSIEGAESYLINPHYPDAIALSTLSARRYYLTMGLLVFPQTTQLLGEFQTVKLVSQSQITPEQKSEQELQFMVLAQQDQGLYQTQDIQLFHKPISTEVSIVNIEPFQSGPDIRYDELKDGSDVSISFEYMSVLTTKEWPIAADIHYQDMLQFSDDLLYQVVQLKDQTVQIWKCIADKSTGLLSDCTNTIKVKVNALTNRMHFQWWVYNGAVHIAYVDSDYSLELWKLGEQGITKETKLIFDASVTPDPLNKVTQILQLNNLLYVLQTGKEQIRVYLSYDDYSVQELINDETMKSLGYRYKWNPQMMWGNPKYLSHLVFIHNSDNIALIKFTNELSVIKSIPSNNIGEIDITIFTHSFFVVRKSGGVDQIQEYSIDNLNRIYLMKQLPLYDYQLQSPLSVTQSDDNGYILIRVTQSGKSYLLMYQPNVLTHDSLYRVLKFTQAIPDGQPLLLSAQGKQTMYVYYNDGNNQNHIAVYLSVQAIITSKFKGDTYVYTTQKGLKVFNTKQTYQFVETVTLINKMTTIYTDVTKLTPLQVKKSKQSQQISIGNEWYAGQVVNFKITCKQCPKDINIIDPIKAINVGAFDKYNIKDIQHFDETHQVFQTISGLIIADEKNQIISSVTYGDTNSCEKVAVHPTSKYVISVCAYNGIYHTYLSKCDQDKCTKLGEAQDLLNIQNVQQIQILNEDILLLLNLGKLYVYHISINDPNWILQLQQTIDIGIYTKTGVGIIDFIALNYEEQYMISVLTTNDQIVFLQSVVEQNNIKVLNSMNQQLYDMIILNEQFAYKTTDYIKIVPIGEYVKSSHALRLLVITSDVAHYGIEFKFTTGGLMNVVSKIQFVLNQYESWTTVNKVSYDQNYVTIGYSNHDKIMIAVYKFPLVDKGTTKPITYTMLGGIVDKVENQKSSQLLICMFLDEQVPKIYSNIIRYSNTEIRLTTFQVTDSPQLLIADGVSVDESQQITIYAQNDFTSTSIVTTLKQIINSDDSSSPLWWIIFIIVSVLVVGAAGGYYVWRRKQIRQQPPSDYQISLME